MRLSRAGLALIRNRNRILLQWNENWQAFSLIGGHVEAGESFRECCIREIAEELALVPRVDFQVSAKPFRPTQSYVAFSRSSGQMTRYEVSLFQTTFARENLLHKVSEDDINLWASEFEIRNRLTFSKQPVAAQVSKVLELFQLLGQRADSD